MIEIIKDIKNGTTTIVECDEYHILEPTQVTVTKKKVKTSEGDLESVKVFTESLVPFDVTLKLLKVLEAVG